MFGFSFNQIEANNFLTVLRKGYRFDLEDAEKAKKFFEMSQEYEICKEISDKIDEYHKLNFRMTKQQLAVNLSKVDWIKIQSDDPHECAVLKFIMTELLLIPQEEAIQLLFDVMEAKELTQKYPSTFDEMLKFRYK